MQFLLVLSKNSANDVMSHLLKVEFNACKILSRAVSEWRYSSDGYVKVLLKMPQQFNCKKCISARPGHLSAPSVEERERKKLS